MSRLGYYEYVDVEKTIEFIVEPQARLQVTVASMHAEIATLHSSITAMHGAIAGRDAIGRRMDDRLDRAIRLGVEMRLQRERRHAAEQMIERVERGFDRLETMIERYLAARGNGHDGHE